MIHTTIFKRHVALPQDHGAWVFLFSPLLIGLFAGKTFEAPSITLVFAALLAFLSRQPIATAVKVFAGRRPKTDLPAALFWGTFYGIIILICLVRMVYLGFGFILYLSLPALPVFAWHLWLVSRREERKQAGVEILASGVLALSAPAALWTGQGAYNSIGWALWLLVWLQSAGSIVYAYLRLAQKDLRIASALRERWKMGFRAILYTGFNAVFAALLGIVGVAPNLIFIPFAIQLSETLWGTQHQAVGAKAVKIGLRQLFISVIFTVLFIIFWR